ncbi:MAG: carotenoid oxygenase family protein [Pseudomonadota bacterium]
MKIELVNTWPSTLPDDDPHPYRTGWWQPNVREYDAYDLPVEGELPQDLAGVYLRNTENPLHPAIGRYHPFDGDGMLHALHLDAGVVEYRNRFVRTPGLAAEMQAGQPLWAGLFESPQKSLRPGCGARTGLKDASSTDVVVHAGRAASTFYQCGDVFELHPRTLEPLGSAAWAKDITPGWGVSAHTKVDEQTGEMLFFNYSKQAPYMHYGVVDAQAQLVHYIPVELPGPRLPHDMAFTERYAILHDFPLFWDADALKHNAHAVRFHQDLPSRFAVLPRRGQPEDVRWFEADPTFVLHVINAYEEGDDVVMDGFYQENPSPRIDTASRDPRALFRMLDTHVIGAKPYRWRMNMATGKLTEGFLHDEVAEFGMINPRYAGRPYRYTWAMETKPGWFVFDALTRLDVTTGEKQRYTFPDGVVASESPMAPRIAGGGEDDGYVITYTSDLNRNESHAEIFTAQDISLGPVARIKLPERICAGTHSYWADAKHLPAT